MGQTRTRESAHSHTRERQNKDQTARAAAGQAGADAASEWRSLRVDLQDEANGGVALLRAAVSAAVVPNLEADRVGHIGGGVGRSWQHAELYDGERTPLDGVGAVVENTVG